MMPLFQRWFGIYAACVVVGAIAGWFVFGHELAGFGVLVGQFVFAVVAIGGDHVDSRLGDWMGASWWGE